jgi:uncharacterized Zn-finger protein
MATNKKKQACTKKKQTVCQRDLPLSCPTDASVLWNAHPKVYLLLDKSGEATCPYCETLYVLKDA